MVLTDILCLMIFIGTIIGFFSGLYIGFTHPKEISADIDLLRNNALVANITAWLRDNKTRILGDADARGTDLSALPDVIANEIEKAHTKKTLK